MDNAELEILEKLSDSVSILSDLLKELLSRSESDDTSIEATKELESIPGMVESIKEGMNTPVEECIPEDEVNQHHSDPTGSIMDDVQKDLRYAADEVRIQESHGIILGKKGKSYVFDEARVRKLIEEDELTVSYVAELAGINVITMRKYVQSLGISTSRKKKTAVRIEESSTAPAASSIPKKQWNWQPKEKSLNEIRDSLPKHLRAGEVVCPVCKKKFYPAPQHIYKNKKGAKVCSYTCARKSGGM